MLSSQCYDPWFQVGNALPGSDTVDIVAVHWPSNGGDLLISIAPEVFGPVSLEIRFKLTKAFQCIDEGYRWAEIPTLGHLIYNVERSRYLTYFRLGAATVMDSYPLRHWIIVSRNQCVDVLSESEPLVVARDV
jgi:hypothetical protein